MKKLHPLKVIIYFLPLLFTSHGNAQAPSTNWSSIILQKDSQFWKGYNACDTTRYEDFFTQNLEFYHDKGGITLGRDALRNSLKNNLCSNSNYRVRREEVPGTVKIFPLEKSGQIYGAILLGDHRFYVTETGKPERLDGRAKFTHVWLLENGVWRMTRILSYDHGPGR